MDHDSDTHSEDEEAFESASEGEQEKEEQERERLEHEQTAPSIVDPAPVVVQETVSAVTRAVQESPSSPLPKAQSAQSSPQQGQPAAAAWGSWGSWLSSAAKSVTEAIENTDVDSIYTKAQTIGQGIRSVTVEHIDRVYESLDPEYEKEKARLREGQAEADEMRPDAEKRLDTEKAASSDQKDAVALLSPVRSVKMPEINSEDLKKQATQSAEVLLSTIDKTLDFASNALGNVVLGGYRNLQTVNLQEKIGQVKQEMKQSGVVDVGENVVTQSLNALELLGQKAISAINKDSLRPRDGHPSPLEGKQDGKSMRITTLTMKVLFEENTGQAHLDALNALSEESLSKVGTLETSKPETFAAVQGLLEKLENNLDPDGLLDDVEDTEISLLDDQDKFQEMTSLLEQLGVSASTQLRQLRSISRKLKTVVEDSVARFEQDWSQVEQDIAWDDTPDKKASTKQFIDENLRNIYTMGIQTLASFAEKSCEQMLRLAEVFLVKIAETRPQETSNEHANEEVINLSVYLRKFVGRLMMETHYITGAYIRTFGDMIVAAKKFDTVFDSLDWDELDDEVRQLYEQLHVDSGRAMNYIQDAARCNVFILKLMILEN